MRVEDFELYAATALLALLVVVTNLLARQNYQLTQRFSQTQPTPAFISPTPTPYSEFLKQETTASCKDIEKDTPELTFLQSFCAGDQCNGYTTKVKCEAVDIVEIKNGKLSEASGQDGIPDCVWNEEEIAPNQCQPKY